MSTNRSTATRHQGAEVDALCTLLQAELSASEAYRTAIHAIERGDGNPALSIRCLYRTHRRFADDLRTMVRERGGYPMGPLTAWCVWEDVHERIAAMNGRADGQATLRVLRHGERYSLALAHECFDDLEGPSASWVREKLVNGIEVNLGLLDALERSGNDEAPDPPAA
jgi:hypothetical protein